MRRIFYASLSKGLFTFFLATLLLNGVIAKAQYWTFFDFSTENPLGADAVRVNGAALELGNKFQFTLPGTVFGIHWYQTASNTGNHTVHLWTNAGVSLATASGNDPGTGWRYFTFVTPVTVSAGTTYVASVFMPNGTYSATNSTTCTGPPNSICWAGPDQTRQYIIGLSTANGAAAPGNGVFIVNPVSAFPNNTNQAANYWVDVDYLPTFPLPVTLTEFKATTASRDIVLSWKTMNETNNRGFEIQRSNNNTDWYALNFVDGAGESNVVKTYNYTDKSLAPGLYYYRLKQTDLDGKSKISSVVTATVAGKGIASLFQNFPNPFSGTTTIRFDLPKAQQIKLSVFDMMGREVKVLASKMSEAGSHLVTLDSRGLSRQVYSIRLKTEAGVLMRQMLVQ